jgi:uncharacterized protein (TIGR00661 family)
MEVKRFIFAVQGEGRGHLTQAIALQEILNKHGHSVCCVLVGKSAARSIPDFFIRKFSVPIIPLNSPNFTRDGQGKGLHMGRTIRDNFLRIPEFRKSLDTIQAAIQEHKPDHLINFYEPLVGLYALLRKPAVDIISIAHQYIYMHPAFRFPGSNVFKKQTLTWYTQLTAYGSSRIIALSMYDLPDVADPKLVVCPPILRPELFRLNPSDGHFTLVYLLNPGYIKDIMRYHRQYPEMKLVCFTDNKDVQEKHKGTWVVDENLVFHSLNDKKFLELMAACKGLVCTAGFESVCEAMYLDKPVMMVPVSGHFEQYCNAVDASRIGAGIHSSSFELGHMNDCYAIYNARKNMGYRQWLGTLEQKLVQLLGTAKPPKETLRMNRRLKKAG